MSHSDNNSLGLTDSMDAVRFIQHKADNEPSFQQLLEQSINQAKQRASVNLDPLLFEILPWPTDVTSYVEYLAEFSRWVPQQSGNPAWSSPENGTAQEVYDRLCHFYYLIDQGVGPDSNTILEDIDWFSLWLTAYADLWGSFLNTEESFSNEILQTFIDFSPEYQVENSMINGKPNKPGGWKTFNEFFSRELNPGLRPIASPNDNSVVVSGADCTFRRAYKIDANSNIPEIIMKKTQKFANINQLLKDSKYANSFANGTFVHYFLGPYSYHRFHTPVSGILEECYAVQGLTYLEVDIQGQQFDAPDNSEGGYEFTQARGIVTIDTTNSPDGDIGIVGVIPVGMAQVSSVNMTAKPGHYVNKGDEFGYFLFGGSDIVLLFQEGKAPVINECDNYRHYGTDISICPPKVAK